MNTIGKIVGVGLLSAVAVGCAPSLEQAEKKLGKYDTNHDAILSKDEARLLLENEFDTNPKDGVLSDEETLNALNYASKIPDNPISDYNYTTFRESRIAILEAILKLRDQKVKEINTGQGTTS